MSTNSQRPEDLLKVFPLNEKKMLQYLKKRILLPENQTFSFSCDAFLLTEYLSIALDQDCCFEILQHRYIAGKVQLSYEMIVVVWENVTPGSKTISHQRKNIFLITLTIDQVLKMCDKCISIREFMDSRYNYNPRISKNMREMINHIADANDEYKKELLTT